MWGLSPRTDRCQSPSPGVALPIFFNNNNNNNNQLLFADDTALVADSEEKLCRLVSEFGRVCKKRKWRVNVGKSKIMRCSRYGNGDRMHVILKVNR